MLLLLLGLAVFAFFVFVRSQQQEANDKLKAQSEDERYDCVVNCPTCEGSGECWMDHRVTSDGHILTPSPERRVDIERRMDEHFQHVRPESYYHVDSYGTSYSYKRSVCPHCEGSGTAYAKFETIPESKRSCQSCSGRGTITQSEKVAVGTNKVSVQCSSCGGSGTATVPQLRKIHVRFLKSQNGRSSDHTFDLSSFEPPNFFDVSKPRFER